MGRSRWEEGEWTQVLCCDYDLYKVFASNPYSKGADGRLFFNTPRGI